VAELRTKPSKHNVARFLAAIGDETVRQDCRTLVKTMGQATHRRPTMWGKSIVGFGTYRYTYASGRSGECFLAASLLANAN